MSEKNKKEEIKEESLDEIDKEKEEKNLNETYEKKLESLKKECCKELKILNSKLDNAQKNKKGYYELFLIENDINIQLELIERNIKNEEEENKYEKMKTEFIELKKELAIIRGEAIE